MSSGLVIGLIIGLVAGWWIKTLYLRSLYRMMVRIRRAMRGGAKRRRRR